MGLQSTSTPEVPDDSRPMDDRELKCGLAREITRLAHARGLTQIETAALLETTQPKVSAIFAGCVEGFSAQRLMRHLNALDHDVHLVVLPKREAEVSGVVTLHVQGSPLGWAGEDHSA